MENEKIIEEQLIKVRANPYSVIPNWMENILIHVGKKVFEVLSLLPCSLILPNIPFSSSSTRAQINMLLLAPPSSGKSTICDKFSQMTYYPIEFRKISSAELITKIMNTRMFTIVNEDFSQIIEDYDVIKVLEGAIGDEKRISEHNMRRNVTIDTQGVSLFCGTPSDLSRYIKNMEGGMFFRLVPLMISHTVKQHEEIGKYINDKIGNASYSEDIKILEEAVFKFYQELAQIQEGTHAKIKPILRYKFEDNFKTEAYNVWKSITSELVSEVEVYWMRELQEFYRFMVAHAFLNVFNGRTKEFKDKDIVGNILVPTREDFKVGIKLMKQNIQFKWCLIKAIGINRRIRDAETLRSILNSNIPEQAKSILLNISPYATASMPQKM